MLMMLSAITEIFVPYSTIILTSIFVSFSPTSLALVTVLRILKERKEFKDAPTICWSIVRFCFSYLKCTVLCNRTDIWAGCPVEISETEDSVSLYVVSNNSPCFFREI